MSDSSLEKQALKMLEQMLKDREYYIDYIGLSCKDYVARCIVYETNGLEVRKHDKVKLCFISQDAKLNIKSIRDYLSIMNRENCNHCIIVYRNNITSIAKKSLDIIDHRIELFSLTELQLNITRHRLVPEHVKILSSDGLPKTLPILLSTDPVARYYDFKRGDIIRVTRKDGTIVYRQTK